MAEVIMAAQNEEALNHDKWPRELGQKLLDKKK